MPPTWVDSQYLNVMKKEWKKYRRNKIRNETLWSQRNNSKIGKKNSLAWSEKQAHWKKL